jgi:protein O-GlcNAc transferase
VINSCNQSSFMNLLLVAIVSGSLVSACGSGPQQKPGGGVKVVSVPNAVPEAQLVFEEGMRQFSMGPKEWGAAKVTLSRAVKLDKNLYEAWHNIGVIDGQLGDWSAAAAAFDHALDVQPASRGSLLGLGHSLVKAGQADKAQKIYKAWLKADPQDRQVRLAYVGALRDGGDGAQALEEVRALLAKDSHDVEAFNALGLVYRKLKRGALANTAFRRALELDGKAAYVWNNLGLLALEQGDDVEAFSHFRKATDIDSGYVVSLLNQGVVYLDSGAYDKALVVLEQAARAKPDDPDIHVALGVAFRGVKRFDDAVTSYNRSLELHPDYSPALYNLGVLYMDHKEDSTKAKAALQSFEKVASAKDPKQQDVKMRLRMLK